MTLSSAHAAVGPIYLFEKGSVLAWGPPADDRSWLLRYLVPAAHAHPGHNHYDGGLAKGEWLGQVVVDGLSDSPAIRATPSASRCFPQTPRARRSGPFRKRISTEWSRVA
ncbi:MAG: hypothetical protein JNL21_26680 [Myxococcales bacterium]|nr:hypothetical protein [Myxococcales bacterium]